MITLRRHIFIAASVLALGAASAVVLAQGVSSPNPHAIKAGTYAIDPNHSQVIFSVSHFGFTDFSGFVSGASGTLSIDPAKPAAAKLDVAIPIASLTTTVSQLSEELKGDKWLDAAKFDTASFASSSVRVTGPGQADVAGSLTLHGVTRPLTLKARFIGTGTNPINKATTVGFSATGHFKRTDFGVSTFAPVIGDDVKLTIAGAFELKS
ncbi:YceI family protein [Sphingomonas fennica]|uniref:Polyisoprenoid-binding protein n=1 Tax=Edaphosphingomonas fennica TaxID=114404 RepID=A0A2T4HLY8_9SPHN|nr:YceI family protein [Sphingomonas fennica]PTD16786.1 polyisoprenoid-binding protein [Sphingomonas fennica]